MPFPWLFAVAVVLSRGPAAVGDAHLGIKTSVLVEKFPPPFQKFVFRKSEPVDGQPRTIGEAEGGRVVWPGLSLAES